MSKKILIVDDSATELLHLKKIVEDANCLVVTAGSGQEAIKKASIELPDLIFMDIVMDELDGYGACRAIRKNEDTSGIPIVFVSSKHQKADHMWAQKQGGVALVSKPYTESQILEQISSCT